MNKQDMTQGSPWKVIISFSLPVLAGYLFQQLYNMVDTIIVGQYLGEEALAGVGSTGCLMFMVLGFTMGISQGFSLMIARVFGAKDFERLKHYTALSILLTLIISVLLTLPTALLSRQFLIWMNCPDNVLPLADSYIKIIFLGIFATMAYNVGSGILRGIGDSKTPLYLLIFSSVLNIFLDIFCIVNLNLGTAGAALATVVSQGLAAMLCFVIMFRKYDILRVSLPHFKMDGFSVWKLLQLGIPMALNYSITAIGTVMMQGAINVYGSATMAAYTAACKLVNIATQTCPTIGTALSTYCGQNLGAGRYDRIKKGMRFGFWLCLFAEITAVVLTLPFGRFLVSLFITNPSEEVYVAAMQYLVACAPFYMPLAWIFMYRNSMQALGSSLVPMLSGITELVARFVIILISQYTLGYKLLVYTDSLTWFITGVVVLIVYYHWEKKHCK